MNIRILIPKLNNYFRFLISNQKVIFYRVSHPFKKYTIRHFLVVTILIVKRCKYLITYNLQKMCNNYGLIKFKHRNNTPLNLFFVTKCLEDQRIWTVKAKENNVMKMYPWCWLQKGYICEMCFWYDLIFMLYCKYLTNRDLPNGSILTIFWW